MLIHYVRKKQGGWFLILMLTDQEKAELKTLKLLEFGEASGQAKITDYCKVVDKIDLVIKENYSFIEKSELI